MAAQLYSKGFVETVLIKLHVLYKFRMTSSAKFKVPMCRKCYCTTKRSNNFFGNVFLLSLAGFKTDQNIQNQGNQVQVQAQHLEKEVGPNNINNINSNVGDSVSFFGAASRFKPSKSFEANDSQLNSSQCLKNAVGLAVDATSAVLSQTVYQIIDVEHEYLQLVDVLITLLEYQIQVLGHEFEEQKMADLVIEARNEINKIQQRKQELAILFSCVEKLAEATTEVAFAAGADYASTSSGERLHSALMEKQRIQKQTEAAEYRLNLVQAQVIEKTMRHEERKSRNKEEREIDSEDSKINNTST